MDPVLYYILVVPALVPVLILLSYCAWLGWQLFINN